MSKALLLVVLGCAAVLVNAAPEPGQSLRIRRGVGDHVKQVAEKTNDLLHKVSNIWSKFLDKVTGRGGKLKQEKINQLKAELQQLQTEFDTAFAAEETLWQEKLAAQEAELQQLQKDVADAEQKLVALREAYAEATKKLVNEYEGKIDELNGRIETALRE